MRIPEEKLKKLLVKPGHILEEDFDSIAEQARRTKKDIQDILVEKGFIKDEQLGKLIANEINIPFIHLDKTKIDETAFKLIPELIARSKQIVAFSKDKNKLQVAMADPSDLEVINMISKRTGLNITPYLATKEDIKKAFIRYKESIEEKFKKILLQIKNPSLSKEQKDETMVDMVNTLLRYGHDNKVSDIHIEPHVKKILIRFRIDGVMHDVLKLPKDLFEYILTRIKIMSKMRTDVHMAAQDGRFRFESNEEKIDVRVSVVPVTKGENIVMRLLSAAIRGYTLANIGLNKKDLDKVQKAIKNPHGMILVTGPTGCGKTTTVYSVLKILNTREIHISSIEDPVEYDVEGVSQIQVNTQTNLTFAKGLRAIVRQDPDIIFVGEIRDEETAEIAINSAMTGHLVLSTLHANDAATTPFRFIDMGIKPFLIAATVNVIIAQRLLRKICTNCRFSYTLEKKDSEKKEQMNEKQIIESNPQIRKTFEEKGYKNLLNMRLYKGLGCDVCNHTGYKGRIGIFEVLEMNGVMKDLIVNRASKDEIAKIAKQQGMSTMIENGVEQALNGVTTLEEVARILYE
ncbi:GspE/PulE family protein [Patescibacteria group bacterium]